MDWFHSLVEILGVVIPIFIFMWASRQSAKKDTAERHKENQNKLDALFEERKFLVPHDHIESEGALQAEGIIRRRSNGPGPRT